MDSITKVALAIVGVAMAATLVVNYKGTSSVISSVGSAFSGSLGAAEKG
jgi:hypothetical protein